MIFEKAVERYVEYAMLRDDVAYYAGLANREVKAEAAIDCVVSLVNDAGLSVAEIETAAQASSIDTTDLLTAELATMTELISLSPEAAMMIGLSEEDQTRTAEQAAQHQASLDHIATIDWVAARIEVDARVIGE